MTSRHAEQQNTQELLAKAAAQRKEAAETTAANSVLDRQITAHQQHTIPRQR